jgi:hypothetical protein
VLYSSQSRERDDVPLVPKPVAEGDRAGGPVRDFDTIVDRLGGTRPVEPPMRSGRPQRFTNNQVAISRPSTGSRMFRALARFCIAILIGVGATLGWQSHGDKAKETVKIFAPSLVRLLPDTTPAAVPATSRELGQQLAPIARDLAAVRRNVDQLAAKQEQMDQSIATLRAIEQDLKQKVAQPPPPRAPPAQPKQPPPAVQSFSAPPPPPPSPLGGPPLR